MPAQRHYGPEHKRLRAYWQQVIDSRGGVPCWRCGVLLEPGTPWDLGHDDNDRRAYRGPECRPCNRGTAAARGNRMRARARPSRWVL